MTSATLNQTYSFQNIARLPEQTLICKGSDVVVLRGTAGTPGMVYEIMAKVKTLPTSRVSCDNGVLTVTNAQESVIYWTGAMEYDINKGTALSGYSFKGPDPHGVVLAHIESISSNLYSAFYRAHIIDVKTTLQRFMLDISQKPDYTHTTDNLIGAYTQTQGNILLEWLLFQYGRYLLFSSAQGTVPSNLQGVWVRDSSPAWSGGTCIYYFHPKVCTDLQQIIMQTLICNNSTGLQRAPILTSHKHFGTIYRSHIKYKPCVPWLMLYPRKPGCHAGSRLRSFCIIQPGDGWHITK